MFCKLLHCKRYFAHKIYFHPFGRIASKFNREVDALQDKLLKNAPGLRFEVSVPGFRRPRFVTIFHAQVVSNQERTQVYFQNKKIKIRRRIARERLRITSFHEYSTHQRSNNGMS